MTHWCTSEDYLLWLHSSTVTNQSDIDVNWRQMTDDDIWRSGVTCTRVTTLILRSLHLPVWAQWLQLWCAGAELESCDPAHVLVPDSPGHRSFLHSLSLLPAHYYCEYFQNSADQWWLEQQWMLPCLQCLHHPDQVISSPILTCLSEKLIRQITSAPSVRKVSRKTNFKVTCLKLTARKICR